MAAPMLGGGPGWVPSGPHGAAGASASGSLATGSRTPWARTGAAGGSAAASEEPAAADGRDPHGAGVRGRRRAGPGGPVTRDAGRPPPSVVPYAGPGPLLLLTTSQGVHDEVARIAAAADRELRVARSLDAAADPAAAVLLVDVAMVSGTPVRVPGSRQREVIVLAGAGDSSVWQAAAELGAHRVAVLPEAAAWLVEHLRPPGDAPAASVIGVAAGCGGAGASTVASWLVQEAATTGPALLLDVDPCSAGLDAVLDSGAVPGLRWADLAGVHGAIHPDQLLSALPRVAGFGVLSGTGGPPSAHVVASALEAARSAAPLVVADLGRTGTGWAESCDAVFVVVPGLRRALPAAAAAAARCPASAVIVRGPLGEGLDEVRVAELVGLPLAGFLPFQRHLDRATGAGGVLGAGRHRGTVRGLRSILAARAAAPPVGAP